MKRRSFLLALAAWPLARTEAATGDEAIPSAYQTIAAQYGVPPDFFYALACTESLTDLRTGRPRPWPWTLNIAGRAARFEQREQASAFLQRQLQAGVLSVDVGLVQVNWRYHGARLGEPWQALEPLHNLQVGAAILREQYEATGDWWAAIGRYHSPGNEARAARYRLAVARQVLRIQREVLAERSQLQPGAALVWTGGRS